MDVAADFANPEVNLIVRNRWDSLAPVKASKAVKKRHTVTAGQTSLASQNNVRQLLTF